MDNLSLIEKLDQAVDALLASPDAPPVAVNAEIDSLLRIAAELRQLPRAEFRAKLRADLERKATVSSESAASKREPTQPTVNPVREGFRTITPYIAVHKVHEVIEFVKTVFGAEGKIYGTGSGGGIHSEFRIGESMLMIGGGENWRGTDMPAALHVYVPNVDEVYERAVKAGATIQHPPADQVYGERSAALVDPGGNEWFPATSMGASYLPAQTQNVMPCLHPIGAPKQIEFLEEAFGAEVVGRHASPEGVILHAKVRVGNALIELGEAHGPWQPMPGMFMLYVEDVDAWYARAMRAEGAISHGAPANQPYGDRVGAVKDPFGNLWYIASHIKDI